MTNSPLLFDVKLARLAVRVERHRTVAVARQERQVHLNVYVCTTYYCRVWCTSCYVTTIELYLRHNTEFTPSRNRQPCWRLFGPGRGNPGPLGEREFVRYYLPVRVALCNLLDIDPSARRDLLLCIDALRAACASNIF